MVRPDITMYVRQCAHFDNSPLNVHEGAVKQMFWCLLKTTEKVLIIKPDWSKGLESYVDTNFSGFWITHCSHDPLYVHFMTWFYIFYAGCPIPWNSKVQLFIVLGTTEAKCVALLSALRKVIGIIRLLDELTKRKFPIHSATQKIACRIFEDKMSCIKTANDHRTRPRWKHFELCLHHFRSYIFNKKITIEHVNTKNQLADMLKKPLPKGWFCAMWKKVMHC